MGFLNNLVAATKQVLVKEVKNPNQPLNILSAAFVKPVQFVTSPTKAIQQTLSQSTTKNIGATITNTAVAASVLSVGAAATGGTGIAATAGTKIISQFSTIKGAATAVVVGSGAIIGTSILTSSPKAVTAVVKTPGNLSNFGANIGAAIEQPSIESGMKILKENPGLSAASAAALLASVGFSGAALANVLSSYRNTEAVQENTKAAIEQPQIINQPQQVATQPGTYIIVNPTPTTDAAAANLTPMKATTTKKKKKKAVKKKVTKKKKKVYKKKKVTKKKKKTKKKVKK